MIISPANRFTSTLRIWCSQCFSSRSCSSAAESPSEYGFIGKLARRIKIDPLTWIHSNMRNQRCFDFSRTKCGLMSYMHGRSSLSHGRARVCPTGWIGISGMVWCVASAQSASSLECLQRMWTSAVSTPAWTKPQLALAVWAVCYPAHTLDRFKFTSASWLLECWHSFFCTHGWLNHRDYFDPTARRSCGVRLAAHLGRGCNGQPAEWTPDRADVYHHLCRKRGGVVAKFRCYSHRTPVRGTSCVDPGHQCRVSGGRRRAKPAARIAHVADYSIRTARTTGSRRKPRVLRDDLDHAVCALRDVHRSEFRSLVSVLRNESGSGLFVDKNLGRRKPRSRRNQIFPVHISRKRIHVAFVPWDLLGQRYVRLRRSGESWEDRLALRKSRVGRVCRNFSWVCAQGAAVSVSHLAARRLPNCAYRRVDGADRCAVKNGRLRIRAPVASIVP